MSTRKFVLAGAKFLKGFWFIVGDVGLLSVFVGHVGAGKGIVANFVQRLPAGKACGVLLKLFRTPGKENAITPIGRRSFARTK